MSASATANARITLQAPRILFFVGIAVIVAGAARQFADASDPRHLVAGLIFTCYLVWVFLEARVTFMPADAEVQHGATTLTYLLARLAVVVCAAAMPIGWSAWSSWLLVPALAFAAGITLRLAGVFTLGRWYSHHVRLGAGHTVVTWGPYRFVRHPAYSGMLLAHVGLVVYVGNPLAAVFLVALIAAVTWRLLMEERVLMDVPGYAQFAEGRRRLIPGVW